MPCNNSCAGRSNFKSLYSSSRTYQLLELLGLFLKSFSFECLSVNVSTAKPYFEETVAVSKADSQGSLSERAYPDRWESRKENRSPYRPAFTEKCWIQGCRSESERAVRSIKRDRRIPASGAAPWSAEEKKSEWPWIIQRIAPRIFAILLRLAQEWLQLFWYAGL